MITHSLHAVWFGKQPACVIGPSTKPIKAISPISVVMATSLEESEKRGPDRSSTIKYLPFRAKIVKIGPS